MYSTNGIYQSDSNVCLMTNKSETLIRDLWDLLGFYGIASTVKIAKEQNQPHIILFESRTFSKVFPCG